LIEDIYEHYPLKLHRKSIHDLIDNAIMKQVVNKLVLPAQPPKAALQKKDLKSMAVLQRLEGLQPKGVLAIAQELSNLLRQIKRFEEEAAKTNVTKAAAQHRIVLPHVEDRVVRSLVQWMYNHGTLSYDDAEHL
jgi:hypothetical protein